MKLFGMGKAVPVPECTGALEGVEVRTDGYSSKFKDIVLEQSSQK